MLRGRVEVVDTLGHKRPSVAASRHPAISFDTQSVELTEPHGEDSGSSPVPRQPCTLETVDLASTMEEIAIEPLRGTFFQLPLPDLTLKV